jgi:hypothetical protein
MSKNYIIWGISDKGYEDSISSSYTGNVIPAEFKASVSDSHRQYAFAFARENPNEPYFYSIEQVGSNVLYTIYRTNFKGGSVGNRLAYDAATIIISKNHILEKPLNSLKLLISSYITQKDSGFGKFNFENALAGIRLIANNDKRSISKRYKAGYIKYHSETELSSVLVDKKDTLHNFNKVYFFIRLNLLEQGENKIQDLKDYNAIPIKIINFDARYYRIVVENNEVNNFGNTFNAYKGEEIKIYKIKGNTPQNVEIAKSGLTITLKKIEPPKPKPQLTNQDIRRKRKSKEKITKYVVLALCSVMILVISGFMLEDNIKGWLGYRSSIPPQPKTAPPAPDSIEIPKVVFNGEYFIKSEEDTSYTITDADALLACFKESISFKDDTTSYKLYFEDDDWKISTDKDQTLKVEDLKLLKGEIEKASNPEITREIVNHINKVIDYNKLRFEGGLELNDIMYKLDDPNITFRKSDSNTEEFTKYTKKINKKLETFLKENLPKKIFEAMIPNPIEFKNKEKVDKTIKKTVTREPDNQVKKPTCTLTKKQKNLKADYWNKTIRDLNNWEGKVDKIPLRNKRIKEALARINAYEACSCSKCKQKLDNPTLKNAKKKLDEE